MNNNNIIINNGNSVLFLFPRCDDEFDKIATSIIGVNVVQEFKRYCSSSSSNIHVSYNEIPKDIALESFNLASVVILVFLDLYDKNNEDMEEVKEIINNRTEATNLLMKKLKECDKSSQPVVFLAYDAETDTNVQSLENVLDYYNEQERAEFMETSQVHLVPFLPRRSLYREIMRKLNILPPTIQPDLQFDPFSFPLNQVSNYVDGTRLWVYKEIRDWFSSSSSSSSSSVNLSESGNDVKNLPILHIFGPPGIGKSTILANVCMGNNQFRFNFEHGSLLMKDGKTPATAPKVSKCGVPVLAFHFFQASNTRSSHVIGAIQTIATQLCSSIPEFHNALFESLNAPLSMEQIKELNTRPIDKTQDEIDDAKDNDILIMLEKYIINPLKKCTAPPHPDFPNGGGLIVIDSIDECFEVKELVLALQNTWVNAPTWIHLLVSTSTPLSFSNSQSGALDDIKEFMKPLELSLHDENNQSDVKATIMKAMELNGIKNESATIADEIQKSFDSNPLILYDILFLKLKSLFEKKEDISIATIKEIAFPTPSTTPISSGPAWEISLLSVIAKTLGDLLNILGNEAYQKIISAVAASREPLPLEILGEVSDKDLVGDNTIITTLVNSGLFLIEKGPDHKAERIRFVHDIIRTFIVNILNLSQDYKNLVVSIPRGHAQLATACDQRIAKIMRDQDSKEDAKDVQSKKSGKSKKKQSNMKYVGIEVDGCESESDYDDDEDDEDDIDNENKDDDVELLSESKNVSKSNDKKSKYPLEDPGNIENADIYSFAHGTMHLLEVNGPAERGIMHSIHFQTLLFRLSCSPPGTTLTLLKKLKKEAGGGRKTNVDEVLDRIIEIVRRFQNSFPSIDSRELASQILGRMYEVAHTDKPTYALYSGARKYHPHVNWYQPLHTEVERVVGSYLTINHEENVSAIAFLPLESFDLTNIKYPICATGSDDGEIRIWNLNNGRCLYDFGISNSDENIENDNDFGGIGVSALAISPSGNKILSGFRDGSIRLYDITKVLQTNMKSGLEIISRGESGVVHVNFSSDGKFILSKNVQEKTSVWDIHGGNVDDETLKSIVWCKYNMQVVPVESKTVLGIGYGSVGFTCDNENKDIVRAFAPLRNHETSSKKNKPTTVVITQGSKVHILKTKV